MLYTAESAWVSDDNRKGMPAVWLAVSVCISPLNSWYNCKLLSDIPTNCEGFYNQGQIMINYTDAITWPTMPYVKLPRSVSHLKFDCGHLVVVSFSALVAQSFRWKVQQTQTKMSPIHSGFQKLLNLYLVFSMVLRGFCTTISMSCALSQKYKHLKNNNCPRNSKMIIVQGTQKWH